MNQPESTLTSPDGSILHLLLPEYDLAVIDALGPVDELLPVDALASESLAAIRLRLGPPHSSEDLAQAKAQLNSVEIRSARRTKRLAIVAGGMAIVCAITLVCRAGSSSDVPPTPNGTTQQLVEPKPAPSENVQILPGSSYKDVLIHYARFGDTALPAQLKEKTVSDVKASLDALDHAHNDKLGLAKLPINTSKDTKDLTADGITLEQFCDSALDTLPISNRILKAIDEKEETLDIVVLDVKDESCLMPPIGIAPDNDVIIYRASKMTTSVMAHEINHTLRYAHDNTYDVQIKNGVVELNRNTKVNERGNKETIAGDGAFDKRLIDTDPISGYELLRNHAITADQVATLNPGVNGEVEIDALTAGSQSNKLINLPLKTPNSINGAESIMLELSHEGESTTLKAYGTGETTENGIARGATYGIPLNPKPDMLGLGLESLNQPVKIVLEDEVITITLKKVGTNGLVTVEVNRS